MFWYSIPRKRNPEEIRGVHFSVFRGVRGIHIGAFRRKLHNYFMIFWNSPTPSSKTFFQTQYFSNSERNAFWPILLAAEYPKKHQKASMRSFPPLGDWSCKRWAARWAGKVISKTIWPLEFEKVGRVQRGGKKSNDNRDIGVPHILKVARAELGGIWFQWQFDDWSYKRLAAQV